MIRTQKILLKHKKKDDILNNKIMKEPKWTFYASPHFVGVEAPKPHTNPVHKVTKSSISAANSPPDTFKYKAKKKNCLSQIVNAIDVSPKGCQQTLSDELIKVSTFPPLNPPLIVQ